MVTHRRDKSTVFSFARIGIWGVPYVYRHHVARLTHVHPEVKKKSLQARSIVPDQSQHHRIRFPSDGKDLGPCTQHMATSSCAIGHGCRERMIGPENSIARGIQERSRRSTTLPMGLWGHTTHSTTAECKTMMEDQKYLTNHAKNQAWKPAKPIPA